MKFISRLGLVGPMSIEVKYLFITRLWRSNPIDNVGNLTKMTAMRSQEIAWDGKD